MTDRVIRFGTEVLNNDQICLVSDLVQTSGVTVVGNYVLNNGTATTNTAAIVDLNSAPYPIGNPLNFTIRRIVGNEYHNLQTAMLYSDQFTLEGTPATNYLGYVRNWCPFTTIPQPPIFLFTQITNKDPRECRADYQQCLPDFLQRFIFGFNACKVTGPADGRVRYGDQVLLISQPSGGNRYSCVASQGCDDVFSPRPNLRTDASRCSTPVSTCPVGNNDVEKAMLFTIYPPNLSPEFIGPCVPPVCPEGYIATCSQCIERKAPGPTEDWFDRLVDWLSQLLNVAREIAVILAIVLAIVILLLVVLVIYLLYRAIR